MGGTSPLCGKFRENNLIFEPLPNLLRTSVNKVFQITFCFPNPHNFRPCWNIGGTWKNCTQTPQIMVLMAKIHLRLHKLWCWWQKFTFDTTNCGVDGKNSPSRPQNVVSKVDFRRHPLQKSTLDTTLCGVEGEFLPSTPQFVMSQVIFCHRHHNLWCPRRNFSSVPNISTVAEIVGVWKTKSYLEDFSYKVLHSHT